MQGKIGLEEHFATPETLNDSKGYLGDSAWPELERLLGRVREARRSLLSASTQPPAERRSDLRGASVAPWSDLGVRPGDRGARAATNGLRSFRCAPAPADHPRPHG